MIRYKFEDLGEQLNVPPAIKGMFQQYFEDIWQWVSKNYKNTKQFKVSSVYKVNLLQYYLLQDNAVPSNWNDIVQSLDATQFSIDFAHTAEYVQNFIDYTDVDWSSFLQICYERDLSANNTNIETNVQAVQRTEVKDKIKEDKRVYTFKAKPLKQQDVQVSRQTSKSDLFIVTAPQYPHVGDFDKKYGNIHVSLPAVPSKQCEISVTTKLEHMTDEQLMNLFPKQLIRTRSPLMYEPREGITLDPDYGLLIPVEGFTDAQVRDCIIRYPHIFQLARIMDNGMFKGFYSDIEIDGELLSTIDAWRYLPEAKILDIDNLPTKQDQIEFIKEYVIRRYLLERDVKGIKHKYEIRGELPEFVTLFMPYEMYRKEGYTDALHLARTCVKSRIKYLKSRNPRLNGPDPTVHDCVFDAYCCGSICDRSCTKWAQINYLMMRNGLTSSSRPFQMKQSALDSYVKAYQGGLNKTNVLVTKDTVKCAENMSYVCVCNQWKGSAMRVRAYHLLFSKYVESIQSSWSSNNKTEELEYMAIWAKSCNALVVSGIDYINFKDFQCQVLLQLIQDRERENKTTFIISPNPDKLAGQGNMFNLLKAKLKQHVKPLSE